MDTLKHLPAYPNMVMQQWHVYDRIGNKESLIFGKEMANNYRSVAVRVMSLRATYTEKNST